MKAETFHFWNLESFQNFHKFLFSFLTFTVYLTPGKILTMREES